MNNHNIAQLLSTALQENHLSLDADTEQKLVKYLELLETWNRVFNLTTITDPRDMVYLHLIDSLSVKPHLNGNRLLDVGSGGGMPGIPLAILNPDQHWVLLDKNSKKTRFLTQAIAELKLTNTQAIHNRCEDFHPDAGFDTIISRAFGTLRLFVDSTAHLLSSTGIFLAMKGKYPQDEINDLPDRFKAEEVLRLDIKGINIERHVVRIRHQPQ